MCLGLFALQDNIPSLLKNEESAVLLRLTFAARDSFLSFRAALSSLYVCLCEFNRTG